MAVVAFANQKGGTGKTTLLMNVAAGLLRSGRRVAVVDADPQGTALRWSQAAPTRPFPVPVSPSGRTEDDIRRAIKAARSHTDVVLVDCPPSVEAHESRVVMSLAQLVVVPIAPSPPDLWATRGIVHLMAGLKRKDGPLKGILVANRVPPRSALGRDVLELLADFELPLARVTIGARAAYAQAAALGASVFDLKRSGAAAAAEIEALTSELLPLMEGETQ